MSLFDPFYKRYDEWYEKPFGKSAYLLEVECLKKTLDTFGRSLEVGVGTGRFATALGIEYGTDPSFNMLRIAKERGIKVIQGKGESLPFRGESFDSVFLIVTLCFVDKPEEVLKESHRVLKREGVLYLGLILKESKWARFYKKKAEEGHPLYSHARFYSFFELKDMTKGLFVFEDLNSTLLEEPQDLKPIQNREIVKGFREEAGFTCLRLRKKFKK